MEFLRIEKMNDNINLDEISVTETFYNISNIIKMKVDRNIIIEDGSLQSCVATIYFKQDNQNGELIETIQISDIETIEDIILQLY